MESKQESKCHVFTVGNEFPRGVQFGTAGDSTFHRVGGRLSPDRSGSCAFVTGTPLRSSNTGNIPNIPEPGKQKMTHGCASQERFWGTAQRNPGDLPGQRPQTSQGAPQELPRDIPRSVPGTVPGSAPGASRGAKGGYGREGLIGGPWRDLGGLNRFWTFRFRCNLTLRPYQAPSPLGPQP